MKITINTIKKLKPCKNRLENYTHNYNNSAFNLKEFLSLDKITYDDKVWVVTRLFTQEQNVRWSIKCAESVLNNFEEQFPDDKRPRQAIEAALNWINNPNEETRSAAESAAWSARSAAWSARSAARSAAWSARSAARSAESAAWSARSAAWSAESAAWSARSAAWSAESAARTAEYSAKLAADASIQQEELNLIYIVDAYNETTKENV